MLFYLNLNISSYIWSKVIERHKSVPAISFKKRRVNKIKIISSPGNVDLFILDTVDHLAGEVEDGVLVRLNRLGCVNDKS